MSDDGGAVFFDEVRAVHALTSVDAESRRQAAQELGRNASAIRDLPRAVGGLCKALESDASDSVREWSAWALGMIGDAGARPHLEDGLWQEMRDVRVHCAQGLGRLRKKESIPALTHCLARETDPVTRAGVVYAMGRFVSDEGVRATLVSIERDPSETDDVRRSASQALRGRRDVPAPGAPLSPVPLALDLDDRVPPPPPPQEWPRFAESPRGTPEIRVYQTTRPVRNSAIKEEHKQRHFWRCQVCGIEGFPMRGGGKYAEAHHIRPLGDGGSDVPENLLCVCPLCHKLLHHASDVQYEYEPGSIRPTAVTINGARCRIRWDE